VPCASGSNEVMLCFAMNFEKLGIIAPSIYSVRAQIRLRRVDKLIMLYIRTV